MKFSHEPISLGIIGVAIILGVVPIIWPNLIGDPWPRISFAALFFWIPMFIVLGLRMLLKRRAKRWDSKDE